MKKSLGANTIAYTAPVWIVGSYDKFEKPNIMAASWGGICCSAPPSLNVCLREATATYHNIMEHKAFTVNIPSVKHLKETDYAGIASGNNTDKFAVTGLTPVASEVVHAPYVKEFVLIAECSLLKTVEIGRHVMFIGEIKDVKAEESILDEMGNPDVSKIDAFCYDPAGYNYYSGVKTVGKAFSEGKAFK